MIEYDRRDRKVIGTEDVEHIRICAEKVESGMGRKLPWHQIEEAWRPLADALKKEGLMR